MQLLVPSLLLLASEGLQGLSIDHVDDPACCDEFTCELGFELKAGGMFGSLESSRFLKFASREEISWDIIWYNGRDIQSPDRPLRN